ncbi:MAG: NAD(+) synthase, partial [Actinobacteria bacterium]|nr:NAD(+) synthase [Actinomycetota bacterium]
QKARIAKAAQSIGIVMAPNMSVGVNVTLKLLEKAAKALAMVEQAEAADADLVLLPEMTITGYPPEDLVFKPGFIGDVRASLEKFAAGTGRCAAVVGFADGPSDGGADGVWNAAAVCAGGKIHGTVGGQDELVFDGGSFAVSPSADGPVVTARCASFVESLDVFDIAVPDRGPTHDRYPTISVTPAVTHVRTPMVAPIAEPLDELAEIWETLVLGARDYVRKSGFTKACLGLSGGVDSSIVAAVAAEALGPENVFGVLMPSRYSSDHSISDAEQLATNLGIATFTVPIEPAHEAFTGMLAPNLADQQINVGDLTDQNLQSRIRGVILMAMANEHGWLVLTTGNKSEAAVGYSTLYGDTAGAYAVIRDVWKLTVYDLCTWRNEVAGRAIIPTNVLTKPPSAELKPDQRDDQSLPDYEILDPI